MAAAAALSGDEEEVGVVASVRELLEAEGDVLLAGMVVIVVLRSVE
jgi:phosphosulfolactate phosphohydrolase-like enzyme